MFHQHLQKPKATLLQRRISGSQRHSTKKDVSLKTHRDCLINMQNQLMKHLNHHYSCQHLQVTILSLLAQELGGAIVTFEQGSFSFKNSSEHKTDFN